MDIPFPPIFSIKFEFEFELNLNESCRVVSTTLDFPFRAAKNEGSIKS